MKIGYFDTFMRFTVVMRFLIRAPGPSGRGPLARGRPKIKTCERMWLTARIMAIIFQRRNDVAKRIRRMCAQLTPETGGNGAAWSALASGRKIYKLFKFWWVCVDGDGHFFCLLQATADILNTTSIASQSNAGFGSAHQNSIDRFPCTLSSTEKMRGQN